MKHHHNLPLFVYLALAILVAGFVGALPAAHAASLHAPHAADAPNAPDRQCSLVTCDAFTLDATLLVTLFAAIVVLLVGSSFDLPLYVRLILDPPPRFIP